MGVSNELARPVSEDAFEAMCHVLYGFVYKDYMFTRMGGVGQKQFGVDILGQSKAGPMGIQCKHYNRKPFTLATVKDDIEKAEKAELEIDHLLFATTASSKSEVVRDVHKLSLERKKQGKFSVSVNFWEDISGYISLFPEVGRGFIPGFPGSTILEIKETTDAYLELYQEDRAQNTQFQALSLNNQEGILNVLSLVQQALTPQARGDEDDPLVVASLNSIRDKLRDGKCRDALDLLKTLGDPSNFKDEYSRFRWHTNYAFVDLLEGDYEKAADGFLKAFDFAPTDEKAHTNKVHGLILKKKYQEALAVSEEALSRFPNNELLWALKLHVLDALGNPEPEKDLPKELIDSSDIQFSLATITRHRGDLRGAINLLKSSMSKDGGSFNAKRTYLADALTWCSSDPVLALHGQLSEEQVEILVDALQKFEPLEKTLPTIQSDHISEELVSNTLYALVLLGDRERVSALASSLLVRHPLHEGLLRIKLQEFEGEDNVKAIHQLTDHILTDLPTSIICILTEISANHGDLNWYNQLMQIVETKELESDRLERLRVVSIQAERQSGNKINAIKLARQYLSGAPKSVLARVLLAQILNELGDFEDAINEALICSADLTEDTHTLEQLQVADLLYWLKRFPEAGQIFSRLVKVFGRDELTRKLLICLIESDQRRKARDILDQLPSGVLQLSEFRRVEANLARRMGDWARMRDLLAEELKLHPENARVAIGYLGALFRLDDKAKAEEYLKSDPKFNDSTPESEFDFAKYQFHAGLTNLAINRLYRLYRDNPASSQFASFYLSQILIGRHIPEMDAPDSICDGCAVHIESGGGERCIAIDIEKFNSSSWPELVSPQTDISKELYGHKIGDQVALNNGLSKTNFTIKAIESVYSFASRKAQELISAIAEPTGPLYSVRVIREDGTFDIQSLLDSAQQRREHVRRVFDSYKQYRFPLSTTAEALGSDSVTLLLEWPFKEISLFVGSGTIQERQNSEQLLKENKHPYVFDLLTIAELVRRKCFDSVVKLIGRPLIPTTVREHLLVLLEAANAPQASSSLGSVDGQIIITETPSEYYSDRLALLNEMLKKIEACCDVHITAGPQEVSETHRLIAEAVDGDSMDVIYLCMERDAILVSEDGALRALAKEAGVLGAMELQPILQAATNEGIISNDKYADVIFLKLAEGHDFVSIRAQDLFTVAKRTPYRVSDVVKAALDSFRKPTLEIISGVSVCCDFLISLILKIEARIAVKYANYMIEVLTHDRPELDGAVREAIANTILNVFDNQQCKLKPKDRRMFNELIAQPKKANITVHRRLIPATIQSLFYRKTY